MHWSYCPIWFQPEKNLRENLFSGLAVSSQLLLKLYFFSVQDSVWALDESLVTIVQGTKYVQVNNKDTWTTSFYSLHCQLWTNFFSCSSVSSSTYMSVRKPFGCLCTIFFFASSDIRNPAIQSKLIKSMIKFFSDCKFILLVAFVFNNYKACRKTKENIFTNW